MKKELLAVAMVVALATGMTTSAMASGHGGRFHGSDVFHGGPGGFRSGHAAMHGGAFTGPGRHGRRFAGGYGGWGYDPYYDGYYGGLGLPGLGVGLAGGYDYCSPNGYRNCGPSFVVGW